MKTAPSARQEAIPQLALAAILGGFVFAAQMFNMPVLPGISAHLVGGVLLAWVLGPSLGAWTMAMVLTAQALILGDGGIAALGANIVNMALLPAGAVHLMRRLDCRRIPVAAGMAGFAVMLAAAIIPLETALFRSAGELAGWSDFATRMFSSHLAAGAAEAALTFVLLLALSPASATATRSLWRKSLVPATFCLALLAGLVICQSGLPDAYEAAAESSGLTWLLK
jgi:cobalt/nickel transport system permease protein